jgi:hypothetical protein
MRKTYELFMGRVYETLLNIHMAESKGKKELDLEPETMKRYKLEGKQEFDYDKDYGKIKVRVNASSSQAADNDAETEKLTALMELKAKYQAIVDEKYMLMYNQIVENSGVDDANKLKYTDDEIEAAKEAAMQPTGDPEADAAQQEQAAQAQQEMQSMQEQIKQLEEQLKSDSNIPYANAPDSIKRQKEERAGYEPATDLDPQSKDFGLRAEQAKLAAVQTAHTIDPATDIQETPGMEGEMEPQATDNGNANFEDDAPAQAEGQPDEALAIEDDREAARQQLMEAGIPEDQIEEILAQIDEEQTNG